ncbi:MAG: hypothetical protein C4297_12480 [Gemmataceae bacterium]
MERLRVSHIFHTFLYRCRTAGRVPADMVIGLLWIAALGSCLVCDGGRLACQPPGVPAAFMHKLPAKHLPNAYRLHEKVISGGQPEGAEAFAELRALGVKTIVSVDGAKPDVELARTYGLRYVHLPIGYNGVPAERARELAKAVRDLQGPIYIHCHHGKHRGPTAAAVACVGAGLLPPGYAVQILRMAGTSPAYQGLYRAAQQARALDPRELDRLQVEFAEALQAAQVTAAMVELDRTFHRLQKVAEAGWRAPADHPDIEPAHETLILREHFTELIRLSQTEGRPRDYIVRLRASERAALTLEDTLKKWRPTPRDLPPAVLSRLFADIQDECTSCHRVYRDRPLNDH